MYFRSLPELEQLGNTSIMSILRWNSRNNMDKTMSASDKAQITMVGCYTENLTLFSIACILLNKLSLFCV